ncbi:hypothetical protein PtrV1_02486 [Pyrenophora tritici-repentis]|nr:hypothetical protein PtrV1_02486 [Pyrenophora tritici-repentis]
MADNQSEISSADSAEAQNQLQNEQSEHLSDSPWAKFTAEQLMENCPYTVALKVINTALWGVPAPADANETHATTWVAKAIHDYNVSMAWDDDLFIDYKWDFEGWTKELFSKVERGTLRSLKSVLRHRGVYTGNNHARVADSLYNILGIENTLEWEPAEFRAMKFDQQSEAYQRQQSNKRQQDTQHTVYPAVQQPPQVQQLPQLLDSATINSIRSLS